jgi:hypothetical protein
MAAPKSEKVNGSDPVEETTDNVAHQFHCPRQLRPTDRSGIPKGPSVLVLGHEKTAKPIHVVWGILKEDTLRLQSQLTDQMRE